jgi:hypothetical protein
VTGVKADIDVGSWGLCSGASPDDFLYFFVDIGAQNAGCQVAGSCLIQFGVVRSPDFGTQYAWAYGGCNGASAFIQTLGSATTSSHNFRIERDAQSVYRFFLDGGQLGISISQNNAQVSCWATGHRGADWLMEKSDFGNGFADKASKSQFDAVMDKISTWGGLVSTSTCFDGQSNDYCTDFADGDFDGWTDNGGTIAPSSARDGAFTAPNADWVGVPWR